MVARGASPLVRSLLPLGLIAFAVLGCGQPTQQSQGTPPDPAGLVIGEVTTSSTAVADLAALSRVQDRWPTLPEGEGDEPEHSLSVDRRSWTESSVVGVLDDARERGRTVLVRLTEGNETELERTVGVRVISRIPDTLYERTYGHPKSEDVLAEGLKPGRHRVVLTVTGRRNGAARGTWIPLDAVRGE